MASSSNSHGAGRRVSSSGENTPSTHTKKRTSRAPPSTQAMADKLKQQQMRERQRTLRAIRTEQDWEMGEPSSSLAMNDPWGSDNSIPVFEGVTLPRQLSRSPFRMPNPDALAAIDPGLAHTNIEYIKDCMELRGEQMYASLRNTSILSLHKPHGPQCFPTTARVRVKHAESDLPTHMLAVRSSLPGGRDLASDPTLQSPSGSLQSASAIRPSAYYTPIHALTLAVYTPQLPALPPSDPSAQLPDDSDTDSDAEMDEAGTVGRRSGIGASVDLTLPVVVVRVPSPCTLGMLIAVLYSQRYDNLVKVLLGIPLIPPAPPSPTTSSTSSSPSEPATPPTPAPRKQSISQSVLFTQSIFSQLFSPLADLPSSVSNIPTSPISPISPISPMNANARHNRLTTRLMHMSRLVALGYLNDSPSPTSPASSKPSSNPFDPTLTSSPTTTTGSTASAHAARTLLHRARLVQALAANARALGVCDLAFWGAIDVAWSVLLGALGFVAGSASTSALVKSESTTGMQGMSTPLAPPNAMDASPA